MPTILIVDDHPFLRAALRLQLTQLLGITEIVEASDGRTGIDIAAQVCPDLVILDLELPRFNGLQVIPRLKGNCPSIRILVISGQDVATYAPRVQAAGAQGFVSKTQEITDTIRCVEAVLAGYTVFPEIATTIDHRATSLQQLSNRELAVMQMLAKGMSNLEIGEALVISNKTVSSHKARIMEKLGAKSIIDILNLAPGDPMKRQEPAAKP